LVRPGHAADMDHLAVDGNVGCGHDTGREAPQGVGAVVAQFLEALDLHRARDCAQR